MTLLKHACTWTVSVVAGLAGTACLDETVESSTQAAATTRTSLCHREASGELVFLADVAARDHAGHLADFPSTDPMCVRPHAEVHLARGAGTLSGPTPHGLATADLDGDGHADLIATNLSDNTISVLRGPATA